MSGDSPAQEASSIPLWGIEPFLDYLEHDAELTQMFILAQMGINLVRIRPELLEFLGSTQKFAADTVDLLMRLVEELEKSEEGRSALERLGYSGKRVEASEAVVPEGSEIWQEIEDLSRSTGHSVSWTEFLEMVEAFAEEAPQRVDKLSQFLSSQAIVALWGSLEVLIKALLTNLLTNDSAAYETKAVRNLRVPLGEYEGLDEEARSLYIIELLEQETRAPFRQGVDRFESLLKVFGLSGSLDADVKRNLYEMSHIRHVLVHRRGVADKRLLSACPWLEFQLGDPVTVDSEAFSRYSNSLDTYVSELLTRMKTRSGVPRASLEEHEERLPRPRPFFMTSQVEELRQLYLSIKSSSEMT